MSEEVIEGFELSRQQKRLWLMQGERNVFVSQCALLLEGALDQDVLRHAFHMAISRHEILRTSFRSLPGMKFPVQVIAEDVSEPDLHEYEETRFAKILIHERQIAFDLKRAPSIRCSLLKLSPDKHMLLITLPALCADTESLTQFALKLSRYYGSRVTRDDLSEEPVQHVDFSEWQQQLSNSAEAGSQKEYWRKHIEAARSAESVVLPHERSLDPKDFAPKMFGFKLAKGISQNIQAIAREYDTSAEIFLLSCWQILVSRLTEQSDVVVGQFCNGRRIKHLRECLGPIGEFLPLHAKIEGTSTFAELLRHNHDAAKANHTHQEYFSIDQSLDGDLLSLPIQFDFTEWPESQIAGGVSFSLRKIYSCTDRYKVRLSVVRRGSGLACELHYNETTYAPETAKRLAGEFKALLKSAVEHPESRIADLEMLSADERRSMLFDWNDTTTEYRRDVCLPELFAEQVRRTPERAAVVYGGEEVSFAELNARANQLAHYLRGLGVGPETSVGVCLERSVEMVVAVLSILKAGGVYVPLEVRQPPPRLQLMLQDAEVRVVLTQQALLESLPRCAAKLVCLDESGADWGREEADNPPALTTADNLAYVIYTSGSTGRPKGVMVTHRSAVNLVTGLEQAIYAHHGPGLRVSLNAQLSFDASVKQLLQLLSGHTLVVIPEAVRASGRELLGYLSEHQVAVLDCTPSQLQLLLEEERWARAAVPQLLLVGGEWLGEELWARLAADSERESYNVYGPTECTVDASVGQVQGERSHIGRPIANTRIYLLDEGLEPVPLGVRGEICIAGECLARGYLKEAEQTAAKFVPEPFTGAAGARMYRTGDVGRYLEDGRLEYLGRLDHQVKVRGVRIELGEIEAALRKHEAVRDAVVQIREDVRQLVGYVAVERRYLPVVNGRTRYQLPNGLAVLHQNKNETDYLFREIFENRTYLRHGIELPDGASVVDVGANIGLFTLFVLEHCRGARVYAFEPIEPIFETLKLNVELYGENVKLFPFGLSDRNRTASFTFYPHYSMMSGLSDYARSTEDVEVVKRYLLNQQDEGTAGADSLLQHADEFLPERFVGQAHQSQLRTLSEIIRSEKLERIDLLKIDVQRAELDVLKGIAEHDWEKIQQVVMEAHDAKGDTSDGRLREISALLEGRGFKVTAEQDEALRGTDRYNLYAARNGSQVQTPASPRSQTTKHTIVAPLASASEFRNALKEQLPEYMIPTAFVLLEKLPQTRNGKVDRAALSALDSRLVEDNADYVAPQTNMEQIVARIWQEALRVERVGANDNFFELGGHSLLAAQVHSRLVSTLGREISMVEMFQYPTVSTLAERLSQDGPRARSLKPVHERAARQKAAMDRQQPIARKVGTAV